MRPNEATLLMMALFVLLVIEHVYSNHYYLVMYKLVYID